MGDGLDLHGIFEHNGTFDYPDYKYEGDCARLKSFVAVFVPFLYSVAILLGLIGNILVLVVLWQKRSRWSVTDNFVLHLSVADILLIFTMPLWAVEAGQGWSFGTGVCKLTGALFKINFYCGIFILACISMYLYFSIVHTVQIFSHTKPRLVQLICVAVWIVCLFLSIPDWMYLKAGDLEKENNENEFTECVYKYSSRTSHLASVMCYQVLGFLFPAIVMFYCYIRILLKCKSDRHVKKQRAVRILLALVLVFFISWTPYNIALLVDTFCFSCRKSSGHCEDLRWTAVKSTAVLGILHSCFNPLIYFGFSEKFRRWVVTIVKRCSCAVDSGDFFPWDSQEIDRATSVQQEEKVSLETMSDTKQTVPQKNNEII